MLFRNPTCTAVRACRAAIRQSDYSVADCASSASGRSDAEGFVATSRPGGAAFYFSTTKVNLLRNSRPAQLWVLLVHLELLCSTIRAFDNSRYVGGSGSGSSRRATSRSCCSRRARAARCAPSMIAKRWSVASSAATRASKNSRSATSGSTWRAGGRSRKVRVVYYGIWDRLEVGGRPPRFASVSLSR